MTCKSISGGLLTGETFSHAISMDRIYQTIRFKLVAKFKRFNNKIKNTSRRLIFLLLFTLCRSWTTVFFSLKTFIMFDSYAIDNYIWNSILIIRRDVQKNIRIM
jgi:hypothetical protein